MRSDRRDDCRPAARQAVGGTQITFGEHQIFFSRPSSACRCREAARDAASRRLRRDVTDADLRDREKAAGLARELGLEWSPVMARQTCTTTSELIASGRSQFSSTIRVTILPAP